MLARAFPRLGIVAAAITLASCRSDKPAGDTSTPSAAPSSAEPHDAAGDANVVTVTASDYSFDAPAEIPAGLTAIHLVNRGPSLHHIQLMKFEGGKTLDDFLAALKGERPPAWAIPAGGPAPPEVGGTSVSIETLEPGDYRLICFIAALDGMPHVMKGMSRALKVVGPSRTASAWGMKPVGPPPGTIHGGLSGIMPGAHSFIEVDLPAGEYGLLWFLPDAKDGKPHSRMAWRNRSQWRRRPDGGANAGGSDGGRERGGYGTASGRGVTGGMAPAQAL